MFWYQSAFYDNKINLHPYDNKSTFAFKNKNFLKTHFECDSPNKDMEWKNLVPKEPEDSDNLF